MKKFLISASLFSIVITTQASFDASSDISPVRCVNEHKVPSNQLSIVPGRASGEAHLRFKSESATSANITVVDQSGKVILQQDNKLATGVNNLPIKNVLTLTEGLYTVKLVTGGKTFSTPLLIWN